MSVLMQVVFVLVCITSITSTVINIVITTHLLKDRNIRSRRKRCEHINVDETFRDEVDRFVEVECRDCGETIYYDLD